MSFKCKNEPKTLPRLTSTFFESEFSKNLAYMNAIIIEEKNKVTMQNVMLPNGILNTAFVYLYFTNSLSVKSHLTVPRAYSEIANPIGAKQNR